MVGDLSSRRATFTVTFGYFEGEKVLFFQNIVHDEIPQKPGKAINGLGRDVAFIPDGYDGVIRSELNEKDYDELYLKAKPIDEVREFLLSK